MMNIINIDKTYGTKDEYWLGSDPSVKVGDIVKIDKMHGLRGSHRSGIFQVIEINSWANDTRFSIDLQNLKKDGTLGKVYDVRYYKRSQK